MQAKNVSCHELSEKTGISTSTIYQVLDGTNENPSIRTMLAIANALGVRVEKFIENT